MISLKQYWKANKRTILSHIRKATDSNAKRQEIIAHIEKSLDNGFIASNSEFNVSDIECDIYRSL